MFLLKTLDSLLILTLNLGKSIIPVLVELLVFHDMSLLNFLSLLSLVEYQLVPTSLEFLGSQLINTILSHLSLYRRQFIKNTSFDIFIYFKDILILLNPLMRSLGDRNS
jgi:hypothetical protein